MFRRIVTIGRHRDAITGRKRFRKRARDCWHAYRVSRARLKYSGVDLNYLPWPPLAPAARLVWLPLASTRRDEPTPNALFFPRFSHLAYSTLLPANRKQTLSDFTVDRADIPRRARCSA